MPDDAAEAALFYHNNDLDDRPALHALVVGVSAYPNLPERGAAEPAEGWPRNTLGLYQLESAALGALRIARWLVKNEDQLTPRLGTVRLLLTSSSIEAANPEWPSCLSLPSPTHDDLLDAAKKWRECAGCHPDSVTLFYFAGHGVRRELGERLLLLHDFGRQGPMLASTLSTKVLFDGMRLSETHKKLARKQLYFFDDCNVTPGVFKKYENLQVPVFWDVESMDTDDREYGIFYATAPGHEAYGNLGGHSLFCEALMRALESQAAVQGKIIRPNNPSWVVTMKSLETALFEGLQSAATAVGVTQRLGRDISGDFQLRNYGAPPSVDIELTIDPTRACTKTGLTFSTVGGLQAKQVGPGIASSPHVFSIEAGGYICKVIHHEPAKFNCPPPFLFEANPRSSGLLIELTNV